MADVLNGFQENLRNVRNENTDLRERIQNTEVYMSKDTILIKNRCDERNLIYTVNDFFIKIFNAREQPEDLKAVHFLGKPGESAIIVKFLYFGQKKFIWRSRTILKDYKNPSNNKPYYLSERLPPMCRELFDAAKDIGVKVVTNNSEVQICQNGKALFRPIHTLEDLNRLYPTTVKHVPKVMATFGRSTKTVKRRKDDNLVQKLENKTPCPNTIN